MAFIPLEAAEGPTRRGFIPIDDAEAPRTRRGFIPLATTKEETPTLAMPDTDWAATQETPAETPPQRLTPAETEIVTQAQRRLGLPDDVPVPALTPQRGFRQAAQELRQAQDQAGRETIARNVERRTGARPEVAANIATGTVQAAGGDLAAASSEANRTGTVAPSGYDFDTRAEYQNKTAIERGLTKGYHGLKNQALGMHRFLAEAVGADAYAEAMTRGRTKNQGKIDAIGQQGDYLTRNFEGALASIVSNTPGLAIGIATGTEAVPLALMGAQVFGDEYATGREKGLDAGMAATRAGIFGAAEVIGEKLGLGDTLKAFRSLSGLGKQSGREVAEAFAESILKATAKQVPGEQLTAGMQFLADKAPGFGLNPKAGLADYLQQAGDTLTQTIMQSAMMAGGGAGVIRGHRALFGESAAGDAPDTFAAGSRPAPSAPLPTAIVPEVGILSRAVNRASAAGHFAPVGPSLAGQEAAAPGAGEANARPVMAEAAPGVPGAYSDAADETFASAPAAADSPVLFAPLGAPDGQDLTTVDAAAHQAASSPLNDKSEPTAGQILGGNAALGHPRVAGLDISVENPAGSIREDKANTPPKWRTEMKDHYGYFKGVPARASDKDHVDVFVKPGTPEDFNGSAFIVDQNNPDGSFDEPKVILGAASIEDAKATYLRNYEPGWERRIRGIKQVAMGELKAMLQDAKAFVKPQPARQILPPEGAEEWDTPYRARVWDEATSKFVRQDVTAGEALKSIDDDIAALEQFQTSPLGIGDRKRRLLGLNKDVFDVYLRDEKSAIAKVAMGHIAKGMATTEAWQLATERQLKNLRKERADVHALVGDAYAKTGAGEADYAAQAASAAAVDHPASSLETQSAQGRGASALERNDAAAGQSDLANVDPHRAADASPAPRRGFTPLEAEIPDEGTVNAFQPGSNYVPFIQDTPSLNPGHVGAPVSAPHAASSRGEPIRREDILIPFMKALNAGVYEGRVKGKNRLGFFRNKIEEVRIKRHADLETAAHELAHLIDSRAPEIRKSWSSGKDWQAIREELRGISYDASKIYEGFAEFVRLYMTQPEVAQAKAPTFSAWFDAFTARHEYGPAIRKAQAGMTQWFGQDAIDRARSKIGDHRPLSDALDGVWDKLRQSTVDDLHGIYRMELELKRGTIEPVGPYESARLSRASHSIADGALRFGAPVKKADGSFGWKGKGLEEILQPVSEQLDDALLYFVGRSANELMAQGREHLFTPGEIDAMLRLRTPERDKAFREYQQWNGAVLDFAEAQGVINPDARALWKRTQYMPFHRIGEAGGFKGKPGDWSGVKALTGGTENVRDILGNMTSNAAMLIDKAVKNEARQKVAALAELQGGGKFMVKIPPEAKPVRIGREQAIDALLKAMGIDQNTALSPFVAKAVKTLRAELEGSPAMIEVMQQNIPPAGGNVVAVLNAGKPTWYEVGDPLVYRALQSIDRTPAHWLVKWLGFPKRLGQMSITLTPDFMIANIARDTIMGSVMSRAGFVPVIDSLQGMSLRLTKDPLYKEFIANGGGMSSMFLDETRFRAKLEKFYRRQGIDYRTVLDAPDKLLNAVEAIADAFEMSTRLGEYRRAVERGEHPRHAAYLGRDVSTDFAMKGDSQVLGFLYDTVMFLRPALVSWDRLYRGLAHDPNKVAIVTKTGLLALVSAALYLLNRDDERFKDLPEWDRDTHWHFFVGDQHFRYPKIWEIGAVASIAERTVEKTLDADPGGLGQDVARIIGNVFHLNVLPQILAPLQEQATNRSGFTKAPIETPGMENQQPFLRAKPTTSETMKALGMATRDLPESLQVNPVRAEALLRGYLNTWALYGLQLSDKAFFGDKTPTMRTDQLPVVRRFYAQEPAQHTKYETMFYDMLEEAKRLQGTLRELDKIGRKDIADEKEREPLATEAKPLERAAKNLSEINADMRKVRRANDLTPDEKRKRLDELTAERNALFKATVQDARQAQAAKKPAAP